MSMRLATLLPIMLLAACSEGTAPLSVDDLVISPPRPGSAVGVAYMTIVNATAAPVTITAVSSPQFEAVEMHETKIADGVSRMRKLDAVTVPARGSVVFERGGRHLMLLRPSGPLDRIELQFQAGSIPVLTLNVSTSG